MRASDLSPAQLADILKPYIVPWMRSAQAAGAGSLAAHALDGGSHTGTLGDAQAPQFLLVSGARPLAGNLSVAAGVTIDGVDISVHAGNPDAHHATATAGAGIAVTGQQISVSLATNPGLTTASGLAVLLQSNPGLILGATGLAVRLQTNSGLALGATGLAMGAPTTLTTATTNSVTTSTHAHAITTTADGDLLRNTILRTDAAGVLRVTEIQASLLSWPGAITIAPTGDLTLDPAGDDVILAASTNLSTANWTSQTTGWGVTYAGSADFRYLYTDELHARVFVADLEQALAGLQRISKSVAILSQPFTAPAAGAPATLWVEDLPGAPDLAVFEAGDIVNVRSFTRTAGSLSISDCWGVVSARVDGTGADEGQQSWTFTRSSGSLAGTMVAGTVVAKGAIALDYGVSGNGYYEVNAVDGAWGQNSPHFDVVTWTTHPGDPANRVTRLRGGNLNGISGFAGEWGMWLRGATDSEYVAAGTNGVRLRNADFTIYNGSNQRTILLEKAGSVKFGTNVDTAATTGFAFDASTGAITIGGPSYASTVTVYGVIVVAAGSSGIGTFTDAGALATVSNLDGVPDGASYKRTTTNEKTGAGRAYAGLDANNALVTRVDPATTWGANPGAGVAGLLLGADYMGYWSGTAWKSYMDSTGKFYLNAGAGSNYLSWDGSTLTISGSINVVSGNAATQTYASTVASTAQTNAASYTDTVAAGKANTSLNNSGISTLINGASIRVGSGTKDVNLNGWNIDAGEIVGQYGGADRVVLNTNGHIISGTAGLTQRGVEVLRSGGSITRALQFVTAIGGGERAAAIDVYTDTNPILPYYNENVLWMETFATTGKAYHRIRMVSQVIELAAGTYASSFDAGSVGGNWTAIPFGTGWGNYGGGYQACQYMRFGNIVFLRGLALLSSGTGANIGNLPSGYRPASGQVMKACQSSAGTTRVDITTAGAINVVGGATTNMWVYLDHIFFTS